MAFMYSLILTGPRLRISANPSISQYKLGHAVVRGASSNLWGLMKINFLCKLHVQCELGRSLLGTSTEQPWLHANICFHCVRRERQHDESCNSTWNVHPDVTHVSSPHITFLKATSVVSVAAGCVILPCTQDLRVFVNSPNNYYIPIFLLSRCPFFVKSPSAGHSWLDQGG